MGRGFTSPRRLAVSEASPPAAASPTSTSTARLPGARAAIGASARKGTEAAASARPLPGSRRVSGSLPDTSARAAGTAARARGTSGARRPTIGAVPCRPPER